MNKMYQIDQDLKDKLVKNFSIIEKMAEDLTTGNVAHKKAAIKGFTLRAKEFILNYTVKEKLFNAEVIPMNEKSNMIKVMHLMILNRCDHSCELCCNKLYNIDELPVATINELKTISTLCITGGEPFMSGINIDQLAEKAKKQFPNIKKVYVYTSGSALLRTFLHQTFDYIDGINIAPKNDHDWVSLESLVFDHDTSRLSSLKENRLYVFKDQVDEFNNHKQIVNLLNLTVIYRVWDKEFNTPDSEIFRRLPIFLD